MVNDIPAFKEVKDLLEGLLGKDVKVNPGKPMVAADLRKLMIAIYVDDKLNMVAVGAMDLPLAAYCGAAVGLMPAAGARTCVKENELTPLIASNTGEVLNVMAALLNKEGAPHVKLYQTFEPGNEAPSDATSRLLALGRRLDLDVNVDGYGDGRYCLSLAG